MTLNVSEYLFKRVNWPFSKKIVLKKNGRLEMETHS